MLYKKYISLHITALYTSKKLSSNSIKTISHLLLTWPIFYITNPALLITFISLLSTIKSIISLCNIAICTKIKIISSISQIVSIGEIDITSLIKLFESYPKYRSATKVALYVEKKVAGLLITHNKSKIDWKSDLATNFINTKAVQDRSIVYNNI